MLIFRGAIWLLDVSRAELVVGLAAGLSWPGGAVIADDAWKLAVGGFSKHARL